MLKVWPLVLSFDQRSLWQASDPFNSNKAFFRSVKYSKESIITWLGVKSQRSISPGIILTETKRGNFMEFLAIGTLFY